MRQGGLDGRCWSGALPGARSALPGVVSPCVSIRSLCGKHNRQYGVQGGGVSRGQRLITGSYIGNGAQKPGTPFMGQDDFELDVTSGPLPDSLRIEEEIGRGTFGVVHRAVNERSGDNVAVKLLRKQSGPFVNLGRIRNEVLAWRELTDHEHAVTFHDCYEDKDNIYLVQELCTGGDLRELFMSREGHHLEEIEVAQVASSVLQIVAHCHQKSMCYGDVKPENFVLKCTYPGPYSLMDPKGPKGYMVLKAVDFGSVKMDAQSGKLRGENGSPLYRAPEAHEGGYGVEVDVWSVGVLLYHLLCGQPPFVHRVISREWEWSSRMALELQPDGLGFAISCIPLDFNGPKWESVSEGAKDLISKMLDRDVEKRITAEAALQHHWVQDNLSKLRMEGLLASLDSADEIGVFS